MSHPFPGVTVRHSRELLDEIDGSNIGTMSPHDMAHTIGRMQAAMRSLLALVDEQGGCHE